MEVCWYRVGLQTWTALHWHFEIARAWDDAPEGNHLRVLSSSERSGHGWEVVPFTEEKGDAAAPVTLTGSTHTQGTSGFSQALVFRAIR